MRCVVISVFIFGMHWYCLSHSGPFYVADFEVGYLTDYICIKIFAVDIYLKSL
jgi:hypothetical protein